jgi:lipid biosynthesis B12-binding/radical SAM protein
MKILLLSCNPVAAPYPVYPLGMSVVASALERAGHAVWQHDMLAHAFSADTLREAVAAAAPGLVGISFRNLDNVNACNEASYIEPLAELVRTVRACCAAPVLIGGPGFSVMPERVLEATGADYGIVGEGERLAVDLADALARGEKPPQRLRRAGASLGAPDMVPARLRRGDPGVLPEGRRGDAAAIQARLPHRCAYCTYPLLEGTRFRPRDVDEVVGEILALQARGAKQIFFTDSIFNDPAGHSRKLVAAMRKRGVNIPWTGFFRPEEIPVAVIEEMKATGLHAIELGSDATSDTTLREMGKAFTFAEVKAVHDRFVGAGVTVSHYFMMGGPGETRETVRRASTTSCSCAARRRSSFWASASCRARRWRSARAATGCWNPERTC